MRLIEANEALRMMENSRHDNPFFNGKTAPVWETAHDFAISCVLACPTIDPEELRPKGEWIKTEYTPNFYCKCSVCGRMMPIGEKTNYCPHCGAKMRGAEE